MAQTVPLLVIPCYQAYLPRIEGDESFHQATLYGSIFPAVWNFQLALHTRGYGTCITTLHLHREAEVRQLLGIPETYIQGCLLPGGPAARRAHVPPGPRRPVDEVVTRDGWDGPDALEWTRHRCYAAHSSSPSLIASNKDLVRLGGTNAFACRVPVVRTVRAAESWRERSHCAAERRQHDSGTRRTEILQTAASLIASSGLRTSLQEIADAAGILPGSLYHHFESKEAILVELIRRYQDDLDRIGQTAQARLDKPDDRPVSDKIVDLGSAIANCAVQHRAALQMSFYEGPSTDPELMKLTRQRPTAIQEAMLQTLRAGRWSGYIKPDIDLPTLADRICQTMLQVGLDVMRHNSSGRPGCRAAVPNHVAGVGSPAARPIRRWTGPMPSKPRTTSSGPGPTTATPTPATKQRMSAPWRERSSAARATKSPRSGTSRRRRASAPEPSIG